MRHGISSGYMDGPRGDFLWHLPSGPLREGNQAPLFEVEFLVDGEPHRDQADQCLTAWLDIKSGRLLHQEPVNQVGFRRVFLPDAGLDWGRGIHFPACPVCRATTLRSGRSTIMDHATKGEAPFANLVKTQLDAQPAVREESRTFPNGGRKVLLFSDGRQKAARLARDIPREVEQDILGKSLRLRPPNYRQPGVSRGPRNTYTLPCSLCCATSTCLCLTVKMLGASNRRLRNSKRIMAATVLANYSRILCRPKAHPDIKSHF